jgi:hypothetical protein
MIYNIMHIWKTNISPLDLPVLINTGIDKNGFGLM